jgi:transaldolase
MTDVVASLGIKIFADGADLADITALAGDPRIAGFTTNPTLMRKAGVEDYPAFIKELVATITDRPISFEVTSDDFAEMERQARALHEFGDNVVVKIPVTDTAGTSSAPLMRRLAGAGVSINATALMTLDQVRDTAEALAGGPPAVISVFAGRIADAGIDPVPIMTEAVALLDPHPDLELLWASPREVLNVLQADQVGCDIITLTPDLLAKLRLFGRDLAQFSLETVKMFRDDAVASGYDF